MSKRFLISRLSALGDVVCSLPVAHHLKSVFPDCQVTWIVDGRFAGIVECCEAVDFVVRAKPGLKPSSWPVLEGEYDAALDLQGLLKSGIAIARAKAQEKVGYHWQREGAWLFSAKVLPDPSSLHIVDQYVDVARSITKCEVPVAFGIRPEPADPNALGVVGPFVVVNAGAGWVTKRWPPQSFASLIDALAEKGLTSVLIGGKAGADVYAANAVIEQCSSRPVSLLGKTSVTELIAVIAQAKAHIGGDTGSTHIAAAVGVPAIGLYSITNPLRSCPYGQRARCLYDPSGLANIPVSSVLAMVEEAVAVD